jgi:hypothetical protein
VYVGNLPDDIREREIEDLFYKVSKTGAWKNFCSSLRAAEYCVSHVLVG